MSRNGFPHGHACQLNVTATEFVPNVEITKEHGLNLSSQLNIGVECQKETNGTFEHVFTILTAKNDFVGKVSTFSLSI